jgi:hypothetical protein
VAFFGFGFYTDVQGRLTGHMELRFFFSLEHGNGNGSNTMATGSLGSSELICFFPFLFSLHEESPPSFIFLGVGNDTSLHISYGSPFLFPMRV